MILDTNEILAFIKSGKLTSLPSKSKKKLAALVWLAEHIPLEKTFTEKDEAALSDPYIKPPITYSESDLADAAEFRDRIHAQALELVHLTRPKVMEVTDRYPVDVYFQQHWDYPGAWYTIVAIPESVKSREALIDTIVRDTLAKYR